MNNLLETARRYYDAGLNVLPADRATKRPIGRWKDYTKQRPKFSDAFPDDLAFDAICIVCGATSGGLTIVDFDQQAIEFDLFAKLAGDALEGLPVETTQSGGRHLGFRSTNCGRNQKLANNASGCTIETRAEGGICLVAPSSGYSMLVGDWANVPTISADRADRLFAIARSLDRKQTKTAAAPIVRQQRTTEFDGESAADYLRRTGAARDSLLRAGWTYLRDEGDREHWRRPGQQIADKTGGTLHKIEGFFYCFTSNAAPLEPSRAYSPLQLVALLDFEGNESEAARHFSQRTISSCRRLDRIIEIDHDIEPSAPIDLVVEDPKPIATSKSRATFPAELYEPDGLVGDLAALANQYAIRPQPEGAVLGALTTMSFLCGRSLALNYNGILNAPNIYGLFLAPSGMGKDAIRRIGSEVAQIYSPGEIVPESFASVQALQNQITRVKKLYWLHDEFGRDLAVMSGENNANVSSIITETLKLYSNATNRAYLPKIVAQEAKGAKRPDPVDRPSMTIFATGNPREYYDATNDAVLRNGYVARFTTVVGRTYSEKRTPTFEEATNAQPFRMPTSIASRVKQWRDFELSAAEEPYLVSFSRESFDVVQAFDRDVERRIKSDADSGAGSSEFVARISEKIWKYALLFTASRYGARPGLVVDQNAAELAVALARYEIDLFGETSERFAPNAQTKLANDVREWARSIGGNFTKSQFTRKFQRRGTLRERSDVLISLLDAEYLVKNGLTYYLIEN